MKGQRWVRYKIWIVLWGMILVLAGCGAGVTEQVTERKANLVTLFSSSAASISSSRQNGEGFKFWIANSSAIAVSALMERYTFLKGQHDDLIEAEKTLENIITELDAAMRKQFQEKFREIGRGVQAVYFLVQPRHLPGEFFPSGKERFLSLGQLFLRDAQAVPGEVPGDRKRV